jgi:acetoacetate decarboxylase
VGLAKSLEELATAPSQTGAVVNDEETLFALWETSRAAIKRLLPPPLSPAKRPLALAMVTRHPRTNAGPVYREAALAVRAEAQGQEGFYFLAMPVTDNVGLIYGHASLGYPKKIADIGFYRQSWQAGGWVERHGVRYFAVDARLTGCVDAPDAESALDEMFAVASGQVAIEAYSLKYCLAPTLEGFDYPPRLVREELVYWPSEIERGQAVVALSPSEYDPWSEVEVARMLGAVYVKGMRSVRQVHVIAAPDPLPYTEFGQLRVDLR